MANDNLYTVLTITLQEAIYGFTKTWTHLDGRSTISISRKSAQPGDVLKVSKKGMFNPKASTPYGDLFIRLQVELRDGAVIYRRWLEAEESKPVSSDGKHGKDEL